MKFILFLITCTYSEIIMKISRKTSLLRYIIEETYLIEANNQNENPISEIKFKLNPETYKALKIMMIQDTENQQQLNSIIEKNNFKVIFQQPIIPKQTFHFRINLYFYNLFQFVPEKITIKEPQMVIYNSKLLNIEFIDHVVIKIFDGSFLLPYKAKTYSDQQFKKEQQTDHGNWKYLLKTQKENIKNSEIQFYFELDEPFLIFKNVERKISISLWGNIHESNEISVINEAAEQEDEFSNIHYYEQDAGKNALRWITSQISDEIQNLSITDEIGNITKPVAIKKKDYIELNMIPRFSLFGQQQCFWNIQFDQSTTKFLQKSSIDNDIYKLEYEFPHMFEIILAKKFNFTVCLPEFGEFFDAEIPYIYKLKKEYKEYGLFDYFGKNCYTFEYENVLPVVMNKKIIIYFSVFKYGIYFKILYIFCLVFVVFMAIFLIHKLEFEMKSKTKKKIEQLIKQNIMYKHSPSAPIQGSFPLDHFKECKEFADQYIECLKTHKFLSKKCRNLQSEYLKCRMDNGLMEKQDMESLGFVKDLEWETEEQENQAIQDRIQKMKDRAKQKFENSQKQYQKKQSILNQHKQIKLLNYYQHILISIKNYKMKTLLYLILILNYLCSHQVTVQEINQFVDEKYKSRELIVLKDEIMSNVFEKLTDIGSGMRGHVKKFDDNTVMKGLKINHVFSELKNYFMLKNLFKKYQNDQFNKELLDKTLMKLKGVIVTKNDPEPYNFEIIQRKNAREKKPVEVWQKYKHVFIKYESLGDTIQKVAIKPLISVKKRIEVEIQILRLFALFRKNKITHNDFHQENLLLNFLPNKDNEKDFTLKVIDFDMMKNTYQDEQEELQHYQYDLFKILENFIIIETENQLLSQHRQKQLQEFLGLENECQNKQSTAEKDFQCLWVWATYNYKTIDIFQLLQKAEGKFIIWFNPVKNGRIQIPIHSPIAQKIINTRFRQKKFKSIDPNQKRLSIQDNNKQNRQQLFLKKINLKLPEGMSNQNLQNNLKQNLQQIFLKKSKDKQSLSVDNNKLKRNSSFLNKINFKLNELTQDKKKIQIQNLLNINKNNEIKNLIQLI